VARSARVVASPKKEALGRSGRTEPSTINLVNHDDFANIIAARRNFMLLVDETLPDLGGEA
jgi:hypothetical protein